jgi:predicted Zn-dependent protease
VRSRDELIALAEHALTHAPGEGQTTVWWERQLSAGPAGAVTTEATTVEIAVLRDGRLGLATTTDVDDAGLERAAAGAARLAATGQEANHPLPDPIPGRAHEGYDARALSLDPAAAGQALAAAAGAWGTWRAAAARTAIASTKGVRAFEERSFGELRVRRHAAPGRSLELAATSVHPHDLDPAALADEAGRLLGSGDPADVTPGEYAVVLGPWAVAEVLRRAALAFAGPRSPLAGKLGTQVAAPCINLSDSPRFAATLPRSYDAEGMPRQPLPLIQDGVAHRLVHDTRSAGLTGAASTGHALEPGGAPIGPVPTNMVLAGGGCEDETDLVRGIERGVYVTRLWYTNAVRPRETLITGVTRDGTFLIEDGEITRPLADMRMTDSVLRVFDCADDLTARGGVASEGRFYGPRFATAVVCPAMRTRMRFTA